jgi:hypothetical protein
MLPLPKLAGWSGMHQSDERMVIAERVKAWLRSGLLLTGWSAEEWARRSGVAATTITRTIASRELIPNFYSLWRLARAANMALPDVTRPAVPLVEWRRYARAGLRGPFDDHAEVWSPERWVALAVQLERRARGFQVGDILYLRPLPDGEVEDGYYTMLHDGDGRRLTEVRGGWLLPLDDGGMPQRLERSLLEARLAGVYSARS